VFFLLYPENEILVLVTFRKFIFLMNVSKMYFLSPELYIHSIFKCNFKKIFDFLFKIRVGMGDLYDNFLYEFFFGI